MRTVDVIKELEQYDPGGENDLAFLVVDHGTGFEFITSVHPKRLENLAGALIRGGRPIGLLRLVGISKRQGKMETRPLSDNDTPTTRARLLEAKASLAQKLEAEGEIQVVRGRELIASSCALARYALARCRDQELRAFAVELPRDLGPTKSGPRTRRGGEGY